MEDEDPETSSYFQPTGNPFNKDVSVNVLYEPRREKTCLLGFQSGLIQTRLYSHRKWLEA